MSSFIQEDKSAVASTTGTLAWSVSPVLRVYHRGAGAEAMLRHVVSILNVCAGACPAQAPELLLNDACTEKVDIYSFGIILWELCTGDMPRLNNLRPVR